MNVIKKLSYELSTILSRIIIAAILLCCIASISKAQTEVMAWGNITGIRIDGQLMEFETSLCVAGKDRNNIVATGKERQEPSYDREGQTQTVTTSLSGFRFIQAVTENGKGKALVSVNTMAISDTVIEGIYFCIELPMKYYKSADMLFLNDHSATKSKINVGTISSDPIAKLVKVTAKGFSIASPFRNLAVQFDQNAVVYLKREKGKPNLLVYVTLAGPGMAKGTQVKRNFNFTAGGVLDTSTVEIGIDAHHPGSKFDGFGGNFRLQNEALDPQVIGYCLDNMRVAWGRVEMPWQLWQPDENTDPVESANAGKLHPFVIESMKMAQKLARLGIPMIISDWSAPQWAIIGEPEDAFKYRSKGIYGYPLNPEKLEKIYASIASYLLYLKQNYGVEPALFSFNESDLGINIRHTGKEHADFIKGIGSYFASKGIVTKLLLGDNSDATTIDFIKPAMNDAATFQYIGAVSFHSWRGCDDATLKKWADAARQLNLPLIVAEGSTDAAAWNYSEIFAEQPFALYEINLYASLCAICQPLTILQWQLTSDYSVLTGNGIFGTTGPLRPTRRFWNLKQLASTPPGAFALPASCNREEVNCTAFGNIASGEYAVHMVNNGAACNAVIQGFPAGITHAIMYVTDETKGMEKTENLQITDGALTIPLAPAAFITLICRK